MLVLKLPESPAVRGLPEGASSLPLPYPGASGSSLLPPSGSVQGTDKIHSILTSSCPPGLTCFCIPVSHQEAYHAVFLWPGDPVVIPTMGPLQQEENIPFLEQGGWDPWGRLGMAHLARTACGQSSCLVPAVSSFLLIAWLPTLELWDTQVSLPSSASLSPCSPPHHFCHIKHLC